MGVRNQNIDLDLTTVLNSWRPTLMKLDHESVFVEEVGLVKRYLFSLIFLHLTDPDPQGHFPFKLHWNQIVPYRSIRRGRIKAAYHPSSLFKKGRKTDFWVPILYGMVQLEWRKIDQVKRTLNKSPKISSHPVGHVSVKATRHKPLSAVRSKQSRFLWFSETRSILSPTSISGTNWF
jgi:hypothetical protein